MWVKGFEVQQGIPLPQRGPKYPWNSLQVGDSFLVRCKILEVGKTMNSLTSCRNWQQRKTGRKFSMREVMGGIRVWRVQ